MSGASWGFVIAGLVLWAAAETYSDPLLAGLIYALALVLFLLAVRLAGGRFASRA